MPDMTIVYENELPNSPGMTIVGMRVDFAPGGAAPPHRHGGCSLSAYVVSGQVWNGKCKEPVEILGAGKSWFEAPGCLHRVSSNHSSTEGATIFASLVLETEVYKKEGMKALIQIEPEYL